VKSEQESSIMLTGKADLQQEIIKWVRSEFGEDVGEGNLMEFLKKSISKNPFPELS
jgi:actin-like ATPase involved in cell morphogenesis